MATNGPSCPDPFPTTNQEDPFYVLRTVVFYPILREDTIPNEGSKFMEEFVRAFGDVVEVKYLFTERMIRVPMPQDPKQPSSIRKFIGCIIAVYRTAAGAYAAVTGVEALKSRFDEARHLNANALKSLTQFVLIDEQMRNNQGFNNPEVSAVRYERDVLVMLEDGLTVDHLQQQINNCGMTGQIRMLSTSPAVSSDVNSPDANIPAVIVTFTRPLHAMVFAACYLSPHHKIKLGIRDSNNNHGGFIWTWTPILIYSYDTSSTVHMSLFESLLFNVTNYNQTVIPFWRNPSEIFPSNVCYTQGVFRPICIRSINGYFPRIIIAVARDITVSDHENVRIVQRFSFYELCMGVEQEQSRLSLPARYLPGMRRWVSCFQLKITKHYSIDRRNFRVTHQIQPMNCVFPILHPDVFNTNEHNFTFMRPMNHYLSEVNKEYKEYWKFKISKLVWKYNRGYKSENFPCLHVVDSDNDSLEYSWTIPVIIYSDGIHIAKAESS